MKKKVYFYHAGCPICVSAEQAVAHGLDPQKYELEKVHLGQSKNRISEAENYGVKSVPAFVIDGQAFHINFGAAIADLKK